LLIYFDLEYILKTFRFLKYFVFTKISSIPWLSNRPRSTTIAYIAQLDLTLTLSEGLIR